MRHSVKNRNFRKKSKRLNKKLRKTRKTKRGGTRYDSEKYLPFQLSYQDITDNADYLVELPDPKNPKSYEINQIYIIQQSIPGMSDRYYYKYIVKSILPKELVVVPVLSKGSTYAKFGNAKRNIKLNNMQYAYKILDKGYLAFSKMSEKMQDDGPFKIKSTTPAYQKLFETNALPDQIRSFYKPNVLPETPNTNA